MNPSNAAQLIQAIRRTPPRAAVDPRHAPVLVKAIHRKDVWEPLARCRMPGVDAAALHPEDPNDPDQMEAAKAICRGCPVRHSCGEWALATREPWGVWGGMSEEERRAELRRRHGRAAA